MKWLWGPVAILSVLGALCRVHVDLWGVLVITLIALLRFLVFECDEKFGPTSQYFIIRKLCLMLSCMGRGGETSTNTEVTGAPKQNLSYVPVPEGEWGGEVPR